MKALSSGTLVALSSLAAVAFAQDSYLCVPVKSTGFEFLNGAWEVANFSIDQERFILRRSREGEGHLDAEWVIFAQVNESIVLATCPTDFSSSGLLSCESSRVRWRFNRQTLRFQYWYYGGYTFGDDQLNGPSMAIGDCSPLQEELD